MNSANETRQGPVFRINDSSQLARSRLGISAMVDAYPGITEDEPNVYTAIDPEAPIAYDPQADDVVGILKEIRNLLRRPEQLIPFFSEQIKTLSGAADGEMSFEATELFRNFYIPPAPRDLQVFAGVGGGLYVTDIAQGQSLRVQMPYPVNGVTVRWTGYAGDPQSFHIVLSADPMIVE